MMDDAVGRILMATKNELEYPSDAGILEDIDLIQIKAESIKADLEFLEDAFQNLEEAVLRQKQIDEIDHTYDIPREVAV